MDVETLVLHAATLSRDDQLEIVARLQDRLFADTEAAIDKDLMTELERRVAEDDADPDGGLSWEQVEEQLATSGVS